MSGKRMRRRHIFCNSWSCKHVVHYAISLGECHVKRLFIKGLDWNNVLWQEAYIVESNIINNLIGMSVKLLIYTDSMRWNCWEEGGGLKIFRVNLILFNYNHTWIVWMRFFKLIPRVNDMPQNSHLIVVFVACMNSFDVFLQ